MSPERDVMAVTCQLLGGRGVIMSAMKRVTMIYT